jgi:hypothetical protein
VVELTNKRKNKKPRANGGRYGFADYSNAPTITHEVPNYKPGDCCTSCGCGRYYFGEEQRSLAMTGGPIVQVTRHKKKVLRCNCCGNIKINPKKIIKWSNEARSAIVLHKIFGMPWHRMSRIQELCGLPIAVSTFWHQAEAVWAEAGKYIVRVLYQYSAESPTLDTDDTGNKIIDVLQAQKELPEAERRACHTTAMCALYGEFKINLYITSLNYCRQNWLELFKQRQNPNKPVIMTDASSQSLPPEEKKKQVESAVCLGGHGKRKIEAFRDTFPLECDFFLQQIKQLYVNEHACKLLTADARLAYHQEHSTAIIQAIYSKIEELFAQKQVEPNSDFGGVLKYWLRHRKGLTAFLRVPQAKLDNNWAEFALRLMALYRNASLFFKTQRSATIMNDLFSIVSTCEANKINAFAYLNWLQVNWQAVQAEPQHYLPWHFKEATEKIATLAA